MSMRKLLTALLPCIVLGLALLFGFSAKAEAANYKYKVTIEDGLYGKVDKHEGTFEYNERWNPNDYKVKVTNNKYYFKGFHISGIEGVVGATKITQDTVFVAT